MELKNFSQVMDEAMEQHKIKEQVEKEINIVKDEIVMNCDGIEYEIPLKDCESVPGALNWLHHMSEKVWVTPERLWRIASCMVRHTGGKCFF